MPINAKRWMDKAKRHLSTAHLNHIEAKYPLDVSFDPSEMDIVRAISIAEAVVSLVESKL